MYMNYIKKISILALLICVLTPVFVFSADPDFPTGSGYNRFNGTGMQDPTIKNKDPFPTGSGYNRFNGSALQPGPVNGDLSKKTLSQLVTDFIVVASEYVLKILLALIILVFLWGLTKYMFKGQGSDTARSEGRKLMLWGIIAIFVLTSVWGLVAVFTSFVGHDDIVIPQFKEVK